MASYGLNFVRIPIGYWSVAPLPGDPYVQGAYDYLRTAVQWAGNHGLKVLLDLHGAPGSQNGFDNSGRRGPIEWTQGNTVDETLAAIRQLRDDYGNNPTVAAIELLNEPMGPQLDLNTIRQFYYDGWGQLSNNPVATVFHDAFEGVTNWNNDYFGAGLSNLVLDTHHYEVFSSGELARTPAQHVGSACDFGGQMASTDKVTIAGEWSGALTDCAKYLNGRGVGARYDGSFNKDGQGSYYIGDCAGKSVGTVAGLSADDKSNIAAFIQAQIAAYEKADGWIFWTWKNEGAPEWHFQDLVRTGLVPQPFESAAGEFRWKSDRLRLVC
jgi:glucan 1,3-beta-glucosidase